MNTKKSIQVLNSLIGIHNDRKEGYKTAVTGTNDTDLLAMFRDFIGSSTRCREELMAEVQQLGGTVDERSTITDNFRELKAALAGHNRNALLSSCVNSEDKALDTYNSVLTNDIDFLTIEQHKMIYKQYVMLKSDHDKMQSVRDLEVAHP
jgi:uncharacterized protein (TIGR02284 family)